MRHSSELRLASHRAFAVLLIAFAIAVSAAPLTRWIARLFFDAYFQQIVRSERLFALTLAVMPVLIVSFAALALARTFLSGSDRARRRTTIAFVLLLAAGMPIGASRVMEGDPLLRLSAEESEALTTLLDIDEFEMQLVGFDVHESDGYLAMRTLHRSPSADAAFQELVRYGTVAGKLYGLCGLYITNPALFRAAKTTIVATGTVPQFWGCTVENVEIAKMIESPNGVRLAPNQTLRQWAECCSQAQYGRDFDIAGGVLPRMFYEEMPRPNNTTARAEPSR